MNLQAAPTEPSKTQQAINVLVKAYETYRELDETKEDGNENLVGVLDKTQIEQLIDPNSNNVVRLQPSYDEIKSVQIDISYFQSSRQEEEVDASKTLRRIAWKVAKMIIKKVISMLS